MTPFYISSSFTIPSYLLSAAHKSEVQPLILVKFRLILSTVKVTLRYYLITHYPIIIYLTTILVSDLVNNLINNLVYNLVSNTVTKLVYYPFFSYIFIEALEPHLIDKVLLSNLSV